MLYWYDEIQKIKSWIDRTSKRIYHCRNFPTIAVIHRTICRKKFHELGLESGTYISLDFW